MDRPGRRRQMTGIVAVIALLTAGCTSAATPAPTTSPTNTPAASAGGPAVSPTAAAFVPDRTIKVGGALAVTGNFAQATAAATQGMQLALAEYEAKGWKFDVTIEDTTGQPTPAITAVGKLINQTKVDFIVGPISSAEGPAVRDPIDQAKVIMSVVSAAVGSITGANCSKYLFRTTSTTYMHGIGFGPWLAKNVGKKMYILTADYAAGTEIADAIKKGFEESGGQVVAYVKAPLSTTDFSSYMPAILNSGADMVSGFFAGQSSISVVKAFHQFGVKNKMKIAYQGSLTSNDLIEAEGAEATEGIIEYFPFTESLPSKEQEDWTKALVAKFPTVKVPNIYNLLGYTATKAVLVGIENARSLETDKVVAAMEASSWQGPAGPIRFNNSHQVPLDYYITEVKNMKHVILDTIPAVEDPNKAECKMP